LVVDATAGQRNEDCTGAAGRHCDQGSAIGKAECDLQYAREHQAHEEGEAEQQGHAHAAVFGALYAPHEAPGYTEEQHEGDERAAGEKGEVQLHADQGAGHRGCHRQREQGIGVAQDTLLRLADFRSGGLRVGADVFHGLAGPPGFCGLVQWHSTSLAAPSSARLF
jgi:hypothetical protein